MGTVASYNLAELEKKKKKKKFIDKAFGYLNCPPVCILGRNGMQMRTAT